ncbi:class III lanthionine synthetase LanKC (plasmid) [Embleya sp. NBC_00888]|uniref:class III lanthionine synthetase LanKC n=1 Tax=Embleya sp. NBC_00888 TaxID=2975960 RepID=UPI002F90D388|nr:class III lanthionine synthetase LanKC [Embleya sp. NBC_00888]
MNKGYAAYCDADRQFYDAPHRLRTDEGGPAAHYETARRELPDGWLRYRSGDWLAFRPVDCRLPDQGWKIHVSACLDNADRVLAAIWDHCVPRGIAFKCMPSPYLLHTRNAKYADRAGSGKFVTVYPADDEQCRDVATDLAALLAGEPGPYILSDLRWGEGPVYVRYGSFADRTCHDANGVLCPAIEDDTGTLVPDRREPTFHVPSWLTLPAFLAPHLAARTATTVGELPYRIERALHFSNGGGVYIGRDLRTDEQVVLKEARPYAGLGADGADAVTRLERERDALRRLSGLVCTPEVHDWFTLGDHRFLVLEFVQGSPLNTFFAHRHPLIETDPSPERLAEYTQWAMRVYGLVENAVAEIHARGVVFNDLHLFNIMMSEDESSVTLLDFEAATVDDETRRQVVANPGFLAPADRRGTDVDRYALACLRIALFLPLTSLFTVDRGKARHLVRIAMAEFPIPEGWLDSALEEILRDRHPDGPAGAAGLAVPAVSHGTGSTHDYLPVTPANWPESRDSMARAIRASATPDREDRCFPGDIAQFAIPGGGACFGHGAAGVLYALAETGAAACPEGEEWLLRTAKNPRSGTPIGFYDGLAGVAWTLDRLGHREQALELVDLILAQDRGTLARDLHSGLAGLGLALDALAASTGEHALQAHAFACAEELAERTRSEPAPTRAGLLYGATGSALLYLRLYERVGESSLLDAAAEALRRDLARCVIAVGGTLQVDEGRRTMPYLGAGSVGIGMVLDDYLAHRADAEFEAARGEIVRAAQARFYAQPGLFRGAAGMVLHLSRTTTEEPGIEPADIRRQIDSLAWGALPYRGQLAFAGEQMMRLSMDLSTGTAGCLLALGSALHDRPVHLPFLPPPTRRP